MSFIHLSLAAVLLLLTSEVSAQEGDNSTEVCVEDGVLPHPDQCDAYYQCSDGELSLKLCEDGLVFSLNSRLQAVCNHPSKDSCDDRPERQEPQSSPDCPRRNGYFPDPDPTVCDKFHYCSGGQANKVTCPSGLIFDPELGQCGWKAQVNREGCMDDKKSGCPEKGDSPHQHVRFANPDACTNFFLCIDGTTRLSGCDEGLVYNELTYSCERPENVPGRCGNQTTTADDDNIEIVKK